MSTTVASSARAYNTCVDDANDPSKDPSCFSRTWTFFEGEWHEGNVAIMGVRTHATWLGSTVFDGARAFEGAAPDLDRHCARVNLSAANFGLRPNVPVELDHSRP
jgi:branched-chain amino acid aminotransferase